MMIVVETFTRDQPGQPLVVRGQVVVWPLTPLVPDGIDGTAAEDVGRPMDGSRDQTDLPSEHPDQNPDADAKAQECMIEQQSVPPITRKVTRIAVHGVAVACNPPVENRIAELDRMLDRYVALKMEKAIR